MRRAMILAFGVAAVACGPGFKPGNLIEATHPNGDPDGTAPILGTRIVDARAHAVGDSTRAWLVPGESATIEYLVVSHTPTSDVLHTAFIACPQASMAGVNGITGCAGATYDAATSDALPAAVPSLVQTLTVQSDVVPGLSTFALTYLGACGDGGVPMLDPLAPALSCPGSPYDQLYRYLVQVIPDVRYANHNPNIHDERYFFDDVLWTEPMPGVPASGCATLTPSSALPFVRMPPHACDRHHPACTEGSASSSELYFGVSPDDREFYPAFDADGHPITGRETIDVGHYVTMGAIASSTHIDDTTGDSVSATWQWPRYGDQLGDDVASSGLPAGILVRFWFVARDHRSGSDWVERDLCLTSQ